MSRKKLLLLLLITSSCIFYVTLHLSPHVDVDFYYFVDTTGSGSGGAFDVLLSAFGSGPISDGQEVIGDDDHELLQLFEKRRQHVQKVCNERYKFQPKDEAKRKLRALKAVAWNYPIQKAFYVDETNKLLMCIIPKVASTTLKTILLYLSVNSSFVTRNSVGYDLVHSGEEWPGELSVKPLSSFTNPRDILHRLTNYTKIIWVRHPLSRLVSAWRSKLAGNNPTYMKNYGEKIIELYQNQTLTSPVTLKRENPGVTLEEFLLYIKNEVTSDEMSDVHWSTYENQCKPCYINYDYIATIENWRSEVHYVLRTFFRQTRPLRELNPDVVDYLESLLAEQPVSKNSSWKATLSDMPQNLMESILKIFSFDFKLFGYDPAFR